MTSRARGSPRTPSSRQPDQRHADAERKRVVHGHTERRVQRHRHVHLQRQGHGTDVEHRHGDHHREPGGGGGLRTRCSQARPSPPRRGTGVLANDQGSSLTKNAVVANPASGTLSLNADGSFTYTATAGFSGADAFTYSAKRPVRADHQHRHRDAHGKAGRDERQLHDVHGHRGGHDRRHGCARE